MDWVIKARMAVAECSFPDYTFLVKESKTTGAVYLQGTYVETDTVSGEREMQYTRRWFLSPEMSRSEVVSTVFKCVMTSMEHRTREWFLYRNRAIYQPHYDVDSLYEICQERDLRQPV